MSEEKFTIDWENVSTKIIPTETFLKIWLEQMGVQGQSLAIVQQSIEHLVHAFLKAEKNPCMGASLLYTAVLPIEGPKPNPLIPDTKLGSCPLCKSGFQVGDYTVRIPLGFVRVGEDCEKIACRMIEVHLACWGMGFHS